MTQEPLRVREARLAALARRQHGVFSTQQAASLGFARSVLADRARSGALIRLYPGVYRVLAAPASWLAETLAACLAWGPGAAASHGCAARLWGLPGYDRASVELVVPRNRRRSFPVAVHRVSSLKPTDLTALRAIPATTVHRTLLDLAGTDRADRVEEALDDALRRGLTSVDRLERYLRAAAVPGVRGIGPLRAMLARRSEATPESVFERRLLRLLQEVGIPTPTCQHALRVRDGSVVRLDFAYPERRLAIEADGYRWHSSRVALESDARRQSVLAAEGWRVIRATWDQLEDPGDLIALIRRGLAASPEP